MPRNIEFQYWCKIENKMYDKAYIEEHLDLAMMSELLEAAQERYIFLQYSENKDTDGVKIFDGDIVEHVDSNRRYAVRHQMGTIGLLYYDSVVMLSNLAHKMRVIGNVYENPELLTED